MRPIERIRRARDAILGCVPGIEYRPFPDSVGRDSSHRDHDVPALLDFLQPPRGLHILEIGCGRGVALSVIARRCQPDRLAAIDIDPRLLEVAAAELPRRGVAAELVRADVRDLPFPDGSFDLILDFGTCFHIARPKEAVREIGRVLKVGGVVAHESRRNQLYSHPFRSALRNVDWAVGGALRLLRSARLWGAHVRQ